MTTQERSVIHMDLEKLIDVMTIPYEQILNVYLYGSRVYECNKENEETSDWDFVVVVKDDTKLPSATISSHQDNASAFGWDICEEEKMYSEEPVGTSMIMYRSDHFVDVTIFKQHIFRTALEEFNEQAVECASLSHFDSEHALRKKCLWLETVPFLVPDVSSIESKAKIRKSFSKKASNSFVKCKKKFVVESGKERVGRKSLWHSLRIIMFGIQVATHGYIYDFGEANVYYKDVVLNLLPQDCDVFTKEKCPQDADENEWVWEQYKRKYTSIKNNLMSKFRECSPMKEPPKNKKTMAKSAKTEREG
jgi:predicted nucleotidyltransferase